MANVCCNPLNKLRYKKAKVRSVLPWMCKKAPTFILNHKIYDNCRKKLAEAVSEFSESSNEDTFDYQDRVC